MNNRIIGRYDIEWDLRIAKILGNVGSKDPRVFLFIGNHRIRYFPFIRFDVNYEIEEFFVKTIDVRLCLPLVVVRFATNVQCCS